MKPAALTHSGVMVRNLANATVAYDDAYTECRDLRARKMAHQLELVAAVLWNRDGVANGRAAVTAVQLARLIVLPVRFAARSHVHLARDWIDACATAEDARARHLSACNETVRQLDAISDMLWSRGDDKHGRAAIRAQRIAATLIDHRKAGLMLESKVAP